MNKIMKKRVEKVINEFDQGYARDYLCACIEGIEMDFNWENYDAIVEQVRTSVGYLNDCNDCGGTCDMLWNALKEEFGWSEEEMEKMWENEIEDMWGGIGSCYENDAYGIQLICLDMVEDWIYDMVNENEKAKVAA